MERTPAWGIEPVPDRLRVLGLLDTGLLWGNLGVSLLVLVAGTYLVPALSLPKALLAILVGSLIGNAMLGVAGMIGADARVPAMVLMRAPLGRQGSWGPTVLNAAQCVGWAIFELLIIATAVAALSDELFGFRAQWLWTLVFGGGRARARAARPGRTSSAASSASSRSGPCSRRSLYLTWWALDGSGFGGLWDRPGEGGLSVWQGVDLVVAITVSWVPLAADYTRFGRDRRSAFWGTGVGYLLPSLWLWGLGAVLFFSRDLTDPAALPAAVAAGGLAATLALLAVTVDETDEAFANVYSAAVSIQNLAPRLPQRVLDRRRGGGRDRRRADDRPALLPDLPAPARLVLRAAVRRAARGLARRAGALHARATSSPGRASALGMIAAWVVGLRALPVALPDGPGVVGRRSSERSTRPSVGDRRDRAELRSSRSALALARRATSSARRH